jgi:hypothetical protein
MDFYSEMSEWKHWINKIWTVLGRLLYINEEL